jgi:hypothetical protein
MPEKICLKCGEKTYGSDELTHCPKCRTRYGQKWFLDPNNARITVTLPKVLRDEISKEAQAESMILSEYAAFILRNRHKKLEESRSEQLETVKPTKKPAQKSPPKKRSHHKETPTASAEPAEELPLTIPEDASPDAATPKTQDDGEIIYKLTDKSMPFDKEISYFDPKTGEIRHGIRHLKSAGHSVITPTA